MAELRDIATAVATVIYEEDAAAGIIDEIDPDTFEELWQWRDGLHTIRRASWFLTNEVETALRKQLARHEAICIHDLIVRVVPGDISRRCLDDAGLRAYMNLSDDAGLCLRITDVKTTGLRALAGKRGDDPDEIVERFFDFEEGPPKLKVSTMEYAPYWCIKPPMAHLERRFDPKFVKPAEEQKALPG